MYVKLNLTTSDKEFLTFYNNTVENNIREDTPYAACQEYSTTYFKRVSYPKTISQIYGVLQYYLMQSIEKKQYIS